MIGAGVVGTAVAYELTRRGCSIIVIEATSDVGTGTSKANNAILHTGFDATPNTNKSRLVKLGHELLLEFATSHNIAVEKTNALMVAWTQDQFAQLDLVLQKSIDNGHHEISRVSASEIARIEPHLAESALGGLQINGEYIIDPWSVPIAFARESAKFGGVFSFKTTVTAIEVGSEISTIITNSGRIDARFVVNSAGLAGTTIDKMFSLKRFKVTPRRGQLVVFNKFVRKLITQIILPEPQKHTKGLLITPTVFGNLMVGPTADDIEDPTATDSTHEGVAKVFDAAYRIIPALRHEEVTAVYAELRAATEESDYRLFTNAEMRYICLDGIRSTGHSASMALAQEAIQRLSECGLEISEPNMNYASLKMPPLGELQLRPADDGEFCVCLCERVTASEISHACTIPIVAANLDGLRRRTRALNGKCQGFYCLADVCQLASQAMAIPIEDLLAGKS